MPEQSVGPASLVLAAAVARRFYLDDRSKLQIAEEFGVSRFKVARLLQLARSSGLVRIQIASPGHVDVDLSARLQERFGLRRAVVVTTTDDRPQTLRDQVGSVAAELVAEVTGADDVLGVAWARAVGAMARTLPRLPSVPVVQLTGAVSLPGSSAHSSGSAHSSDSASGSDSSFDTDSSFDIVRDVARAAGGPAFVYYAPIVLPDPALAAALRQQSDVARAFDRIPSITVAVVGLGLCAPGRSTLYDAVTDADRDELRRLGVCAEVAGVFLTADGEPVETEVSRRVIALDAEQLRAIPDVLVIAYGVEKVPAARAALRSGLVSGLVTHAGFARSLLDAV